MSVSAKGISIWLLWPAAIGSERRGETAFPSEAYRNGIGCVIARGIV